MPQSKKLIAILDHISHGSHLYYGRLAAELRSREKNYDLITVDNLDTLPLLPIDGVIYRDNLDSDRGILEQLQNKGINVVVLDSRDEAFPSIISDFEPGSIEAIKHLKELGRTRIAYIKGRPIDATANKRHEAFRKTIAENGLEYNEDLVTEGAFDYKISGDAATKLLTKHKDIEAIVCCSDRAANGVVNAAKHLGYRIPEDVAIVGLGNSPELLELAEHPLSTVLHPIFTTSYQAVSKLIRRIENRDTQPNNEKVPSHLIIRQSTIGKDYSEPIIDATVTKDGGSLNYILSIGASLSELQRNELKQLCADKLATGNDSVTVIREVILKAIGYGLDAAYAHELSSKLLNIKKKEESKAKLPVSQLLHSLVSKQMTKFGRYFWVTQREIDSFLANWGNRPEPVLSKEELINSLVALHESIYFEFIGLLQLDEPVDNLELLKGQTGSLTIVNEDGCHEITGAIFEKLIDTLRQKRSKQSSFSSDFIPLWVDGKIDSVLVTDTSSEFGLFNRKRKPLIEGKLHRVRLVETLEKSKEELTRQKALADQANKAKSEFLAVMSHEIRTPLNCIIGMTELTLDMELSQKQRDYLELALKAGRDQLELINELLHLSKIESGALEITSKPYSLREVVEHITDVTQKQALDKGMAYEVRVAQDVPDHLIGDSSSLHRVLTNLVSNAVKFTNEGKVSLHIDLANDPNPQSLIRIQVKDTGIGIPAESVESIFSPFEQIDKSSRRKTDGVGLGLAIVKRTIEGMNGAIEVESRLDQGSCFTIDLPLITQAPSKNSDSVIPFPNNTDSVSSLEEKSSILVVDDNDTNRLLVKTILNSAGQQVTEAASGQESLELQNTESFDCILMDVGMPGMNGYETTECLRFHESSQELSRTPIIALTAHTMPEDERACIDAGMDGFLPKPFDRQVLLETVLNF